MTVRSLLVSWGLSVSLCAAAALAGPLTPPGAPAPTMKTLDELEPRIPIGPLTTPGDADSKYKISVAGSYYLTGDIIADDLKSGIEIGVSNVTLDLMGFEMIGAQLFGQGTDGIRIDRSQENITIRNGIVRDWGNDGIDLALSENALIEEIVAAANGDSGVIAGVRAVVQRCRADGNGRTGISLSDGSITDCTATGSVIGYGISATGSAVARCYVSGSQNGYFVSGSNVTDCVAESNTFVGFEGGASAIFERCNAILNGDWGFDGSASVVSCNATANEGGGIRALTGVVRDCNVVGNTDFGISASSTVRVVGNTCWANSGADPESANIRLTGVNARAENNIVRDGVVGIRVTGGDNLIIGNLAGGNTIAFVIAPGNAAGDILNLSGGATITTGNNWINVILD